MDQVIYRYAITALLALMLLALAPVMAKFLLARQWIRSTGNVRSWLFFIGTWILLVAAIGRLGWSIQSLGGNTLPEKLDQWIFLGLSGIGTFILVLDFFLDRDNKRL